MVHAGILFKPKIAALAFDARLLRFRDTRNIFFNAISCSKGRKK